MVLFMLVLSVAVDSQAKTSKLMLVLCKSMSVATHSLVVSGGCMCVFLGGKC